MERRAAEIAQKMKAEFWAVSSRTGNGVSELFARVAVLSFHAMVLDELQNVKFESRNIGSELLSK